jgi:hypothetical protein
MVTYKQYKKYDRWAKFWLGVVIADVTFMIIFILMNTH